MTDSVPQRIANFEARAQKAGETLGLGAERVRTALKTRDYFHLVEGMVPLRETAPAEPLRELREAAEGLLRIKAFGFPPPGPRGGLTPVVFGTGGHRGEIGLGITLTHIGVIVQALLTQIEQMNPARREQAFGAAAMEGVRERGFLIGHDNRLFNEEFSMYTGHLLSEAGYRVGYCGRVASPQVSLAVPRLGWAGAFNFTPSHNPFRYGGIKVSPGDGGLVGMEISDPLAEEANRLLLASKEADWPPLEELERALIRRKKEITRVDLHTPYLEALKQHPVIRLGELAQSLRESAREKTVCYVADPVFGGAVPVYRELQTLLGEGVLSLVNIEDDPYFGGQTTEPNKETLAQARRLLEKSTAQHKVAVRNDPDGDRGIVGDDRRAIPMNQFAALVMKYLIDLGRSGDVVTTVATSRFGGDYARAHGCAVHLTPVGFKNFPPFLRNGQSMVAYEESDGITIAGHTLDKDGVLAGLLALRIVLHYGKPLSELVEEIERETGVYHYLQINFQVELTAAEVHQKLRKLASVQPGQILGQGTARRTVAAINTADGYLFDFQEGGWIMLRPSGTEPKVRIYAESNHSVEEMNLLIELGKAIAMDVIQGG